MITGTDLAFEIDSTPPPSSSSASSPKQQPQQHDNDNKDSKDDAENQKPRKPTAGGDLMVFEGFGIQKGAKPSGGGDGNPADRFERKVFKPTKLPDYSKNAPIIKQRVGIKAKPKISRPAATTAATTDDANADNKNKHDTAAPSKTASDDVNNSSALDVSAISSNSAADENVGALRPRNSNNNVMFSTPISNNKNRNVVDSNNFFGNLSPLNEGQSPVSASKVSIMLSKITDKNGDNNGYSSQRRSHQQQSLDACSPLATVQCRAVPRIAAASVALCLQQQQQQFQPQQGNNTNNSNLFTPLVSSPSRHQQQHQHQQTAASPLSGYVDHFLFRDQTQRLTEELHGSQQPAFAPTAPITTRVLNRLKDCTHAVWMLIRWFWDNGMRFIYRVCHAMPVEPNGQNAFGVWFSIFVSIGVLVYIWVQLTKPASTRLIDI